MDQRPEVIDAGPAPGGGTKCGPGSIAPQRPPSSTFEYRDLFKHMQMMIDITRILDKHEKYTPHAWFGDADHDTATQSSAAVA